MTLSTPYVWIDLDIMERNIRDMTAGLAANGVRHRPHIKTHRSVEIARMQAAAGARGITCAKLSEAMVMAKAGFNDIFLAYSLVGRDKMRRLADLMDFADISVTVDNWVSAEQLSNLGKEIGRDIPVFVEVMTSIMRGGVGPGELAAFIRRLGDYPRVAIAGLFCYSGVWPDLGDKDKIRAFALREANLLTEARDMLNAEGISVPYLSGGSSVTSTCPEALSPLDESRAGNYVFSDLNYVATGAVSVDDCAMRIKATVISRPASGKATLDAGSKILSSDQRGTGFGLIRQYPTARIFKLNEEHAFVDFEPGAPVPAIGEEVDILPNHACVVSNLVEYMYGFRKDAFERAIRVDARGMSY